MEKTLGKSLFKKLMKMSFYGHFVAGENPKEVRVSSQIKNKQSAFEHLFFATRTVLVYHFVISLFINFFLATVCSFLVLCIAFYCK